MASLYKRASPAQRKLLKMIEGAIKNACDAHPRQHIPDRFRRSIAKRAAGTISAQWPELLAAATSSDRDSSQILKGIPKGGGSPVLSRSPFKLLHVRLGLMAGWARKAGHEKRAAAFADALRVVASVEAELKDR